MNMLRQFTFICVFFITTFQCYANDKDIILSDNNADATYQLLSNAFASLDPQKMTNVYTKNGIYISARSELSIVHGHDELYKVYEKYFNSLKNHNSSIDLKFRVTNRFVDTQTVHDIGYYLVTVIPSEETKQPPRQHAGKFMITLNKQSNGRWGIWSEANSKSPNSSFINAKKVDGLYFDKYQPIEHYMLNKDE